MYKLEDLNKLSWGELEKIAQELKISKEECGETKEDLLYKILDKQAVNIPKKITSSTPKSNKKKNTLHPVEKAIKTQQAPSEDLSTTHRKKKNTNSNLKQEIAEKKEEVKKYPTQPELFEGLIEVTGVLDIMNEGYGFLRSPDYNYQSSPDDVYVSQLLIKQWRLKIGDTVTGKLRLPRTGEKYFGLKQILTVNGSTQEELQQRKRFEHLVPLFPDEKLNLVLSSTSYSTRIVDLISPIGKGQRGMIVAPPKAGKTFLLKDIANGIAKNHPDVYLIILLINERPEEVTDMQRSVKGEVVASTFDESPENHVKVANIVIEKAKRMVESGQDVVILLDSLTRLARAYNTITPSSGKILSGGVDANALQRPKKFFGAARNVEHGGSLTIIATALIDTGSRMDEVIFEEFKGTGNMESWLDRKIANRGIYPPIDIRSSGTRRDDLLRTTAEHKLTGALTHILADMTGREAINFLLDKMRGTPNNKVFLQNMQN